jgi:hypothetical protein
LRPAAREAAMIDVITDHADAIAASGQSPL